MNKNEVVNESCGIGTSLETIDGQMSFFSHLIEDCERHPEGMAAMLKHGELQKQLNAVYSLLHYELEKMKEYNENIMKVSDKEGSN